MPDNNELLKSTPEVVIENNSVKTREIITDRKPEAFVPREVQSLLQKMEQDPTQSSVINDQNQPQLTPSTPTDPKIVLPTTRTNFVSGFKKKVDDVGLWLSKFLFREIKLKNGNVSFKPDDS